jgi:nicotinamidase/pyrazinamidase
MFDRTFDRRQVLTGLGAIAGATAMATIFPHALWAAAIKPDDASALLVIDVQNCFLPGGSLAVKDGEQVVPVINRIAKSFANVVMTQDWHTSGHVSFASSHAGKKPFETVDLAYGKQVLWPDHCVQGTDGASLSKDLAIPQAGLVIRKGFHKDVDSYSAFTEADGKTTTGLAAYLKARKVKRLYRARCAQGRLRNLCSRGRLPRYRHPGLDGQGLGRHGQGRRQADPVCGYRGLTSPLPLAGEVGAKRRVGEALSTRAV